MLCIYVFICLFCGRSYIFVIIYIQCWYNYMFTKRQIKKEVKKQDEGNFHPMLYQLMKQPNFRRQLRYLPLSKVIEINYQYPFLLRQEDQKFAKKQAIKLAYHGVIGIISGVVLSACVSKFFPKIFNLRPQMRILIRGLCYFIPAQLIYSLAITKQRQKINKRMAQTHKDLVNLGINGNLHQYFSAKSQPQPITMQDKQKQ